MQPSELESILSTHPLVADAAVVGLWSDERATELPAAFVVLKNGCDGSREIGAHIAEFVEDKVSRSIFRQPAFVDFMVLQVASHKKLRGGVFVVDSIPRSTAGKCDAFAIQGSR